MSQTRLELALADPGGWPADGRMLVLGPHAPAVIAGLPRDRTVIVQGFRPVHDALAADGWRVLPEVEAAGEGFAAALVFLPRARAAARDLIAEAAARVVPGGPVWADGQKTDGIDPLLRDVRALAPVPEPIAKAHGKIFRFPAGDAFAAWRADDLHPAPGFVTRPGVFSAEAVDPGSALLAAALPDRLPARLADLGAGWGWLSAAILARPAVEELHLIEADHLALSCARRAITDPRARFHWADATGPGLPGRFGGIVMNPPFHHGRAADPALGAAFIAAAARLLAPSGQLWMVANRHLPYERSLSEHFAEVAPFGEGAGFKLLHAAHPQPPAARSRIRRGPAPRPRR